MQSQVSQHLLPVGGTSFLHGDVVLIKKNQTKKKFKNLRLLSKKLLKPREYVILLAEVFMIDE